MIRGTVRNGSCRRGRACRPAHASDRLKMRAPRSDRPWQVTKPLLSHGTRLVAKTCVPFTHSARPTSPSTRPDPRRSRGGAGCRRADRAAHKRRRLIGFDSPTHAFLGLWISPEAELVSHPRTP